MTIVERADADLKEAMKSKDEVRLSVVRLIRTAFKNKQIELMHPLADAEAVAVLRGMIKQYQDALVDFENAGRADLAQRQKQEIELVASYLPPAMSDEELERIVHDAVAQSGATDFGKAMGAAVKAVAGRADGAAVKRFVEQALKS